jgi:hypothetical protein
MDEYTQTVRRMTDTCLSWLSEILQDVGRLPEDHPKRVRVEAAAEAFLISVRLGEMVLLDEKLGELLDSTAGPTNEP